MSFSAVGAIAELIARIISHGLGTVGGRYRSDDNDPRCPTFGGVAFFGADDLRAGAFKPFHIGNSGRFIDIAVICITVRSGILACRRIAELITRIIGHGLGTVRGRHRSDDDDPCFPSLGCIAFFGADDLSAGTYQRPDIRDSGRLIDIAVGSFSSRAVVTRLCSVTV